MYQTRSTNFEFSKQTQSNKSLKNSISLRTKTCKKFEKMLLKIEMSFEIKMSFVIVEISKNACKSIEVMIVDY
jgi:hypothetical protein